MKVKDLIEKLKTFDPELPVCLADWQEQYATEPEGPAELVSVSGGDYNNTEYKMVNGLHVIIGE